MKKLIVSLFLGGLMSFSPMLASAQSQGAMEAYLCTLNDGKSLVDVMEVVEDWNEWSDSRGINNYTAWVMSPIYASNTDLNRQALWLGHAPSFKELSGVMGAWYSEGGDLLSDFNEAWTCNTHMEMTAMMVRRPAGEPSGAPVASFYDCSLNDSKGPEDLMAATGAWNKHLDDNGIQEAMVYHFPAHGHPQDAAYDMKLSVWRSDLEMYGNSADHFVNGGGQQAARATLGQAFTCDSPRMYQATTVRMAEG
ncbi:hypothetical protein N9W66_09650 [Luminiphilus sp.]|nr:hypothetical protein [Luminiphilus sp.]